MKIAYVITRSDEIGGAHIHVRDMAVWMLHKGHDVKIFVGGSGVYTQKLSDAGLAFHSLKHMRRPISPIHDILSIVELKKALKKYNPDIVSAHSAKAGLIARIACRKLNIPCIFTAHGWSFADGINKYKRKLYIAIERFLAPLASKIITVCESDRLLAIKYKVCPESSIVTVHNGMPEIPIDLISRPINESARIIMVARFESQKDHKTLLLALANLTKLDWTLDLIGDGPLMESIIDYSKKLGIDQRINFLGRRWDVPSILAKSDIFVLTSFWEGFPRSIIEAMRAGLPIIASNVAGVSEAVLDTQTGFLIHPSDHINLEHKLKDLILDPDTRNALGRRGRDRYLNYFTFEKMASKNLYIYTTALPKIEL